MAVTHPDGSPVHIPSLRFCVWHAFTLKPEVARTTEAERLAAIRKAFPGDAAAKLIDDRIAQVRGTMHQTG